MPEAAIGKVTAVIDEYHARYGMDPRENCKRSRQAGSHISKPTCVYDDKFETLQEVERRTLNQSAIGTRRGDGELGPGL